MYTGHLVEKWDALLLNGRLIADMFFMAPDYDGRSVTVTVTVTPRGWKGLNASPTRDSARKNVRVEKDEEGEYVIPYQNGHNLGVLCYPDISSLENFGRLPGSSIDGFLRYEMMYLFLIAATWKWESDAIWK